MRRSDRALNVPWRGGGRSVLVRCMEIEMMKPKWVYAQGLAQLAAIKINRSELFVRTPFS